MEGMRKRGRQWKRWPDEVEEDMKVIGIINWRRMATDRKEWGRIVLKPQVHKGPSSWRREEYRHEP